MDLEATAKSLSKPRSFSTKRIAFLAVVGLCVVGGIVLRASQYYGEPTGEQTAPVAVPAAAPSAPPATESTVPETTQPPAAPPPAAEATVPEAVPATQEAVSAPTAPAEPVGDAAHQEQPELPGSGMILVAKRPVELLASPSSSASVMYGFPAGRPFRMIGREGSFAKIQDLRSGASGWIDATALAAPPPRTQTYSAPSQQKPATVGGKPATVGGKPATVGGKPATAAATPKPKVTKKATGVPSDPAEAADAESVQPSQRPGLFGQGGLFGGIFGNKTQP